MTAPSLTLARRADRYAKALAGVTPPFAFVDLEALRHNAGEMLGRTNGKPVRVASKSLRCRALQRRILSEHGGGYRGLLTFTLPETNWLQREGEDDLLLAYPSVDEQALAELARVSAERPGAAPRVVVDCERHLELVQNAWRAAGSGAPVRVVIEADASYRIAGGRMAIGPKRSPIRTPGDAAALARSIELRPGCELGGLMVYEGQIAGVGDDLPGNPLKSAVIRRMQRASASELAERRAGIAGAVESIAPLPLVNGGGTGSLHLTSLEPAVTELAAGSGFYAPALFDSYRYFSLEPAAMFVLPVVRRPSDRVATVLGGGYPASGAAGRDRLPTPYIPEGLKLDGFEGAGEVQTPLHGDGAAHLQIGDRVYFRHAKAGELAERFDSLLLVEGDAIVDEVPTYRGEGKTFL